MRGFFVFILLFYTGLILYTCKIIPGYHLGHANQTHTVCRVTTALKKTITELQENICFSYIKCNAVKQIARVKSLTWRTWKDQSSPKPNDRCQKGQTSHSTKQDYQLEIVQMTANTLHNNPFHQLILYLQYNSHACIKPHMNTQTQVFSDTSYSGDQALLKLI